MRQVLLTFVRDRTQHYANRCKVWVLHQHLPFSSLALGRGSLLAASSRRLNGLGMGSMPMHATYTAGIFTWSTEDRLMQMPVVAQLVDAR